MRSPWPEVGWETHTWVPSTVWGVEAARRPKRTIYRAALPARVAEITPVAHPDAVEAAEEAGQELSRFDAELGSRIAAFAPVLLRSEAASSSQIENLTASARAIFTAELGARAGRNAELVAANTRALQSAIDLSRDISPGAIMEMHSVLMAEEARHTPGQWREEAVWIGTRTDSPVGASFVAPHHSHIEELIDDLVRFTQRSEIQALISVAVVHAQFETIHPFTDGNGRTGRALAQAQLRHRSVTRNIAVPVSAGLLADVDGYHRALQAYRQGDISPIVAAFAAAALRAVGNSRTLVAEIDAIRASWNTRLRARRDSNAWRLLDVLMRRPVLDSRSAAEELGVRQPNVYPPMRTLVDAGIVKSKAEHQRGPFWRSPEVLAALDAFATRAGRREAR